ncbi:MAG: PAS domain S-box protein [Desulfobacterales bacterium]|nr:MAG: PAS domain S-box protein [Desulfobacterales bacterium]
MTGKQTNAELEKKISELEATIHQYRQNEKKLRIAHDALENQVGQQINQLEEVNQSLRLEIEERKNVEKELRISEERFRQVAENIREVFWLFDWNDQKVLYVNPAYEIIWGRSREALYHRCEEWAESIYPDDLEAAQESFARILQTGGGEGREYRIVRPDGMIRWISDKGFPIYDENGDVIRITGIAEDITAKKRAEHALQTSEARYRSLIEQSPVGINIFRPDGSVAFSNEAMRKLHNLSPEEHEALVSTYNIWQDQQLQTKGILPLIQKGFSGQALALPVIAYDLDKLIPEWRGSRKSIWIESYIYPIMDEAGEVREVVLVHQDITERKLAEEALRTSEANYRELFNAEPDAIVIFDAETKKIVDANSSALQLYGYTHDEICGLPVIALSAEPEKSARYIDETASKVSSGSPQPLVQRLHHNKQGAVFPVEFSHSLYNREGRKLICAILRDISERKRAETALRDSEERFRSVVDSAAVGIAQATPEGRLTLVNDRFCELIGYSREELLQRTHDDITHPDDLAAEQRKIKRYRTGASGPSVIEKRYLRKDGMPIWVNVAAVAVRDAAGAERYSIAVVQDITKRKRAEDALKAETARLAVTLLSIGDGVITTDRDGRITLLNRIAEKLTGWTQAEAIGKPLPQVFTIVNELTRQPCDDPVRQVIESGKIVGLANNTVLLSRDGSEYVIADSGAPILDPDKNIVGAVLVFRDVTEKRKMEKEIQKVEKLESLGVLAGGIAHDFNNFLAGILGNLSLAKLDLRPTDAVYPRLQEMEKAALRAKNLTQQLLTFSKGGEPVRSTAELTQLTKESALFALRGSNVRCDFEFEADVLFAEVDEGQISQVIHNLILNADQAMPEGGIIYIRGERIALLPSNALSLEAGEYAKLTIQDRGTGIKKEHLKKVFDPYFTTKQKGSGLGLAVAYSIIDKHNGRITVDSELGVGTTFSIYLPAVPESECKPTDAKSPIRYGAGRILVMDDEDFIRELASQMLKKMGYAAALAQDGEQALHLYKQALASGQPFDAVILDLTVPGRMGGKETIRNLLKIDPNVKAIVSSGYSNDPVMSDYGLYGFQTAVRKPYLIQELSEALQSVLQKSKKEQ